MRTSCLINNYNYSKFVVEAVQSALNQSVAFDEIIIVDDASTDNSVEVIQHHFEDHPIVKTIFKEKNEGQLSSFNTGVAVATGDLLFFLDADDLYKRQYLEIALKIYENYPDCDFLISAHQAFRSAEPGQKPEEGRSPDFAQPTVQIIDLGYSIISCWHRQRFVGGRTSTLSMRKKVADQFMPVPYLQDWRIRADDCLVYGASMAGARKFKVNAPLIDYRIHQTNNFAHTQGDKQRASSPGAVSSSYKRRVAINKLLNHCYNRLSYSTNLSELAAFEFQTIRKPSSSLLLLYAGIILYSDLALSEKLKSLSLIFKWFAGSRRKSFYETLRWCTEMSESSLYNRELQQMTR
ncbi:MAG TPA: glycosyltransferase family 2 protein [Chroococcidiopsis sp.]